MLNHKFEACNEPFNNISIARLLTQLLTYSLTYSFTYSLIYSAFNGMRNTNSDVEEVRAVIKSLSKLYALTTEKVTHSLTRLPTHSLAHSLIANGVNSWCSSLWYEKYVIK